MTNLDAESGNPRARREELALIERAKRRDADALRQLIDAHKDRLAAFIWRMVRNHDDVEDICQEAFLKAFAALHTFDPSYRFSTWLFTIAYRLTLNAARRKKPVSGDIDLATFEGAGPSAADEVASSEEARHLKSVVWTAVDRLSAPQRAAVLLFYKQQQSCHEIAAILDIPVATVKSHLHRARTKLRDLLEPQLAEENTRYRILREFAG